MIETRVMQKFNIHIFGTGDQTLVMAHGFGSDQTAWRYQTKALCSQYRIVLFDYIGYGKSDISTYSPLRYNSVESYRDDVLEIYDALDLTGTIFIGHSMSAMIGMLAASAQPERFTKLVFVGASPRYLNDDGYVGGFNQSDLNSLYETMAVNYLDWSSGFAPLAIANPHRPELAQEFVRTLSSMRPDIAQSIARVIFESDFRSQLSSIQQPVLLLQAQRDIVVPAAVGDYLAARIPRNKLIFLNAEGHLPHLSAPDEVLSAIQQFIPDRSI